MNNIYNQNQPPAVLNLPDAGQNGQKQRIPCTFGLIEGKRLVLQSEVRLAAGAAVSVEYEDSMFLGEVVSCIPVENGCYKLELRIAQVLTGLQSLFILRSRLLGDGVGAGSSRDRVPVNAAA